MASNGLKGQINQIEVIEQRLSFCFELIYLLKFYDNEKVKSLSTSASEASEAPKSLYSIAFKNHQIFG